ncbi:hypothetical protein CJF42_16740 [Pseudoalteromonas sp. NBT06-2]|nr:hypothetical protein CJF42_16740 [Pseudoalteromonas sp. NBT06-2]
MMKYPYLTNKLHLTGFIDHTFNQDNPNAFPTNPIVAEAQLGFNLMDNLFMVAKYGFNQYRNQI